MKIYCLLIILFTLTVGMIKEAEAEDDFAWLGVVLLIILEEDEEPVIDPNPEGFMCSVPTAEPFVPPLKGSNYCTGGGELKALSLQKTAIGFGVLGSRGIDLDRACTAIRNYKYCGFDDHPESTYCNQRRVLRITYGDAAALVDCD